jgi:hypothetical protein
MNTMNRCLKPLLAGLALWAAAAQAQVFPPADVERGILTISATPPLVMMNERPDRLSPGSRIRNTNNMLLLSGHITGQSFPVVYKRDSAGLVHEVWVLKPEEARKLAALGNVNSIESRQKFATLLNELFSARR